MCRAQLKSVRQMNPNICNICVLSEFSQMSVVLILWVSQLNVKVSEANGTSFSQKRALDNLQGHTASVVMDSPLRSVGITLNAIGIDLST